MRTRLSYTLQIQLSTLLHLDCTPGDPGKPQARAGWLVGTRFAGRILRALLRRDLVEACDHHVPIFWHALRPGPDGRLYMECPERHFYRVSEHGLAYLRRFIDVSLLSAQAAANETGDP